MGELKVIVEHRYCVTIRAHVFSYLRDRAIPLFSFSLRFFLFICPLLFVREITISMSRHSDSFLYLATKDVRVELNQAIGLNNSLLNEFVTFDVGISKCSPFGEKEKYMHASISHNFLFDRRFFIIYCLCNIYMYVYCRPRSTWLLHHVTGMSNVIRKQ